MPPHLLDLTDEVLQRIAYFTNRDSIIPLPSYGPHWQNFRGDIRSSSAKDLLAFRSTCKRIRDICELENIHLYIQDWMKCRYWLNTSSLEVEKAVSRLRYHPQSSGSDILSAWTSFSTLLHNFSSLKELLMDESFSCSHTYYDYDSSQLEKSPRLPRYPILTNLKSLSISIDCPACSIIIPHMILPAAKQLEHLKVRLVAPEEYTSDTVDYSPSESFKKIIDTWCKDDGSGSRRNQLKTLYLKYPPLRSDRIKSGWTGTIKEAVKSLPHLEDFRSTQYYKNEDMLAAGITVRGRKNEKGDWYFRVKKPVVDAGQDEYQSFEDVVKEICPESTPTHLKYLDLIILIELDDIRLMNRVATLTQTRRSWLKGRPNKDLVAIKEDQAEQAEYEVNFRHAAAAIATTLLKYFPTLGGGALWERGSETNELDWLQWNWTRSGNKVIIENCPWVLPPEFVGSREGRRTPKLPSGDDYPYSDSDSGTSSGSEDDDDN
ncbi:hypothetical protein V865_001767 [Kwoniella europaea PYCC6329]|uniref:F-box domain-containing protein n=1 Tax=Kwoniella europaea PYCC6329 TaxID=1423913 RepID=A0AAX4KB29_9TREE